VRNATRILATGLAAALVSALVGALAITTPTGPGLTVAPSAAAEPPASTTTPYAPRPGAVFNQPRSTGLNETRIERTILDAINHAPAGSTIRFAVFTIDRTNIADALVKAHARGVQVQVLTSPLMAGSQAVTILKRALGADRRASSFLHVCKGSCRSDRGKMHTKVYLFSQAGAARNVVMTGSHNLTNESVHDQWNNLAVLVHKQAYDTFVKVFNEMRRDLGERARYKVIPISARYRLQVMPFWNASPNHDPVMDILNRVRCHGASPGTGTKNGRTIVRVSVMAWQGARGTWLARKVRSLHSSGCDVRLLYSMAGAGVRQVLRAGEVPTRVDGFDTDGDGKVDKYTHNKYLLISGSMLGGSVKRVYTGSGNWSEVGLRGDEQIFMLGGRGFARWIDNFNLIWSRHSRPL
jgi:phosphatidylserine/phosphatidylglycerophosphate/cardiolipin synthase-like enzyme